jgi:hypothetical protein
MSIERAEISLNASALGQNAPQNATEAASQSWGSLPREKLALVVLQSVIYREYSGDLDVAL